MGVVSADLGERVDPIEGMRPLDAWPRTKGGVSEAWC
jgi:hypothetical protein